MVIQYHANSAAGDSAGDSAEHEEVVVLCKCLVLHRSPLNRNEKLNVLSRNLDRIFYHKIFDHFRVLSKILNRNSPDHILFILSNKKFYCFFNITLFYILITEGCFFRNTRAYNKQTIHLMKPFDIFHYFLYN